MSEGFGLGDGINDLSGVSGLADSKVSEAQHRRGRFAHTGHWPDVGTVVRVLIGGLVGIVILGWALTAINS